MIGTVALRTAVFARLTGAITGGVYGRVPPTAAKPYTVLGETTALPWDTHDSGGSENTLALHTYGATPNLEEVEGIMEEIRALLHDASLAIGTGTLVQLRLDFADARVDQLDSKLEAHGVMRFRALISA